MTTETALDPAKPKTAVATPGQTSRVLPQYEMVAIDDEGAASKADLDYYKGRKGVTDRLSVLDLKNIAAGRTHFQEGLGSIMCRSTFARQETQGPNGTIYADVMTAKAGCCELLGESSKRFAVPVVHYNTNPKGDWVKPITFALKIWRFGVERFSNLQKAHIEFRESGGLGTHDIKFTCDDDQWQRGTLVACADSMYANAKFKEQHGELITNWLNITRPEMRRVVGRDMTDEEIKKKLAELLPSAATVPAEAVGQVSSLETLLD